MYICIYNIKMCGEIRQIFGAENNEVPEGRQSDFCSIYIRKLSDLLPALIKISVLKDK